MKEIKAVTFISIIALLGQGCYGSQCVAVDVGVVQLTDSTTTHAGPVEQWQPAGQRKQCDIVGLPASVEGTDIKVKACSS